MDHLGRMLDCARTLNAERHTYCDEVQQQHDEDEQFHRKRVGDGRGGIDDMHMQPAQQRVCRCGEVGIQKSGKG